MDCVRCGNPTPERAAFCPACGARVPGGPAPAPPTIRLNRPLVPDEGTVVPGPGPAPSARQPSDVTVIGGGAIRDADATFISPGAIDVERQAPAAAPVAAARGDADATVIGRPAAARVADRDATVLAAPVDPDATMMGGPPVGRPLDLDATVMGAPLDPDATFLGGRPGAGTSPGDVTVIGPPPRKRTGTPVRMSAARAGRTMGGHEVQPDEGGGPLAVGEQFGRYTIIRLLGIGGMGAVYQAWDEELEVVVAVKVIQTDGSIDAATVAEVERRFKRELLLARRVTHKNVVRIFDLGEIDGIKYITMSYVNGVDLTHLLETEGKLALPKALQIVRGVVDGLVAAHDADVVHRDLKPANIMLAAGTEEPLIMDFGIARTTSAPQEKSQGLSEDDAGFKESSALASATMAGAVVGTLGYMAPEQAKGKDVDQRADIYALGLIFYDLLLGMRRQEATPKPFEELMLRMKEPPPSPRSVDQEIPEDIDRIIMRCIHPDPATRYPTSKALKDDLDGLDAEGKPLPKFRRLTSRMVAAAAVVMVTLLGLTYWLVKPTIEVQPDPMSVLVADFENRTGEAVFAGTLEQALGTGLEGASFITAYSRQSAQKLAEQIKPGSRLDSSVARLISAREGIKVVLAGSIASAESGYEIKVDAIDPANDAVLTTARTRARSRNEVLAAIGSVAADLRGALGDTTPESARLAASETVTASSLEALQAYTRAQALAAANKNDEALKAYEETVAIDPNFGRAYAGMGVVYSTSKDEAKAKAAYDQALKLVDRMSEREKYRTLGTYYMNVARNYEKAIENYEELVRLYPADDVGHGNLGLAYLYTGNIPRAVEEVKKVLTLYPNQWADRYNYAMYSMYAGDFETAISEGRRVIKEAATFEYAFLPVVLSTLAKGDFAGALDVYRQLEASGPAGASLARYGRADMEMYRGRVRQALTNLEEGIPIDEKEGNTGTLAQSYIAAAQARLVLGQPKAAVLAARKAVKLSSHESVLFPASEIFLEAGRDGDAEEIAVTLENMLQTHTTAYAQLIRARIAAANNRYAQSIELFRDSIKRRDTWMARYLLGRTYAELERFPEAMAELDLCVKRHGEVTDVFIYDTPTLRYLPPAYYWLARAQQAMGVADARTNYERFLSLRQDADAPDPLVEDARKRLGT